MKSAVYSLLGPALPLDLGYFASLPVDSRLGVSPARHSPQPTVDVDITMDPLTNFVDINGSASLNQWLVQLGDDHFTEISGSSADDEIAKAFEEMAAFCVSPHLSSSVPVPNTRCMLTNAQRPTLNHPMSTTQARHYTTSRHASRDS